MAPPVITITRQYASGGSDVARLVAVGLAWTVIDNEFVDQVAQRAGLPVEEVAQREERAPGLLQRLDALHVYVVAPKPWRMKLAVERLGVDPASAAQVVDETDRQRDQYVKTYYGRHRHDFVNYDLVVNTERLGLDGAAAVIVAEARRR